MIVDFPVAVAPFAVTPIETVTGLGSSLAETNTTDGED